MPKRSSGEELIVTCSHDDVNEMMWPAMDPLDELDVCVHSNCLRIPFSPCCSLDHWVRPGNISTDHTEEKEGAQHFFLP